MKKSVVLKSVVFSVLAFFLGTGDAFSSNRIEPQINNGILDLRNWDFQEDGIEASEPRFCNLPVKNSAHAPAHASGFKNSRYGDGQPCLHQ
jgi:hypothetical protein